MTITIRELLENVKHYPLETAVVIEDVDDAEFAIVDFNQAPSGREQARGNREQGKK